MFMKACHERVDLALKEGDILCQTSVEPLAWSKASGRLEEEINDLPTITTPPWDPIYGA